MPETRLAPVQVWVCLGDRTGVMRVSENGPCETVWKILSTNQPPYHQANHRHIDERFSSGAQSLVVVAHPSVLREPREGALHYPAPRQYYEASFGHQLLPIEFLALLGQLFCPDHCHFLGDRLLRFAHDLHTQAQDLFRPPPASALVARIQPQVLQS